jgi:hypothetical protein
MRLVSDTLIGIPGASDVGIDTLLFIALDRGGLFDTLLQNIIVVHTNHAPVISSWEGPDSICQYGRAQWLLSVADKDLDDSLSVIWAAKPGWMSVAAASGQGTKRLFTFTAVPLATDKGWVPFAFSIHDAAGASVSVMDSVYIITLPTTFISRSQNAFGAVRYSVSGGNGKEPAATFEASLRSLDDTSLAISRKNTNGTFEFFPLLDGRYEFTARAIDAQGLRDTMPPRDVTTVSGASRHRFSDTSWTMLSIPCLAYSAATLAKNGHVLHWDESIGEEDIYRYYRRESAIDKTSPGLSYWRKSADTITITLTQQDLSDSAAIIRVNKGAYGWNQVASPYPYPVKWPREATLWKWNNRTNDYEDGDGILEPWQGYWIMTDSAASVRIDNVPVFSSAATAKRSIAYFNTTSDWRIRVSLFGRDGNDADNSFGFSPNAKDEYDIADRPEPPRLSDTRYAFFWHPEWGRSVKEFASDLRHRMKKINVFQIGIAPSQSQNTPVRIRFQGVENLSSLYCYLADADTVLFIDGEKEYELAAAASTVFKTIFVTADRDYLKKFPLRFALTQPFPNPCRPMAVISYTLPYRFAKNGLLNERPYTVRMALFDAMGRKVRQLIDRKQEPGSYRVVWDGKSSSGRLAAPGAYFCRLEANEYSSIVRLTMMR